MKAVVLVSGGLDSATTLAIARSQNLECHALSVDYGQRHRAELDAAAKVANSLGAIQHRVIRVDMSGIGGSALTDANLAVPESPQTGIPITYVPARNTVMLSLALGWAEVLGADQIWIGVNAVDYSGYPDCRPEFVKEFERLANLATKAGVEGEPFRLHAPLQDLTKADIARNAIDLARALGVPTPKVAILSAIETVTSRIPSTIDAAALCKMADRGQIEGGLLDGPLGFDNAINREAAAVKHIASDVAGDADILLVPDLEAGNMLAKSLTFFAGADAAGVVLGARVPIMLTSRADSMRARMASCAVAMLYANARLVPADVLGSDR